MDTKESFSALMAQLLAPDLAIYREINYLILTKAPLSQTHFFWRANLWSIFHFWVSGPNN
jgi:hypothetical protein